jgi:hypothetical protein
MASMQVSGGAFAPVLAPALGVEVDLGGCGDVEARSPQVFSRLGWHLHPPGEMWCGVPSPRATAS